MKKNALTKQTSLGKQPRPLIAKELADVAGGAAIKAIGPR